MQENGEELRSQGLTNRFAGTSILMNVLQVLLGIVLVLIVISLVLCCKFVILPMCPSCFRTLLQKIERKLFWNTFLRAFLETYFAVAITFWLSMNSIDAYSIEGKIELITWLLMGAFCFGFPICSFRFLNNRYDQLNTQENRNRYDALYQNVDV